MTDAAFPQVEGVEHRFVRAGGLRHHVAQAGAADAPPLLLLHGWPQHWYMWRKVIPSLRDDFCLIAPDLRGFGWSDAPAGGYDKEQLATDTFALLDALNLERVRVLGHDWGGWVAFLMALRAPERIERMVILNVPHPFQRFSMRLLPAALRLSYQPVLAAPWLGPRFVRGRLLERGLRAELVHPEALSDADVEAFAARLREPARARASVLLYRTFLLRELPAVGRGRYRSQRLHAPTRIVFGARDRAVSTGWLDGAGAHADDLEVELVPDSGHFIAEEKPELVARRAREFLGGGG